MAGVRGYKGWLSGDLKGCYLRGTVAELAHAHAWCLHDARMTYVYVYACAYVYAYVYAHVYVYEICICVVRRMAHALERK